MIRQTLDNRTFRVVFALLVGIPATLIYLVALLYGAGFGIAAFSNLDPIAASFGIATVLGTFGVVGVWLRLARPVNKFTEKQLKFTRVSLICGTLASLILMGIAIWWEGYLIFGVPLFMLAILGVVFYVGT
jgi:hypothetical protein